MTGLIVLLVSFAPISRAQDYQSMVMSQLRAAIEQFLDQQDFVQGRPYFKEFIDRTEGSLPPEQKVGRDNALFFYAFSFVQEYTRGEDHEQVDPLVKAIPEFEKYLEEYPNGNRAHMALLNIADCYRGQQKYLESVPILQKVLDIGPPVSGLITPKVREDTWHKIVQGYYYSSTWDEGIPVFKIALQEMKRADYQADAAAAIIEGNINLGKIEESLTYLPYLTGDSPARFKLKFNVTLFQAGQKLMEMERYNNASLLFNMTLTPVRIKEYFEERIVIKKRRIDQLMINPNPVAMQIVQELEVDVRNSEQELALLAQQEDYTPALKFLIAKAYVMTKRDWEAFWSYYELYQLYPESPEFEIFTYTAYAQAYKTLMSDYLEELGEYYLSREDFTSYVREVAVQLVGHYAKTEQYEKFFRLCDMFISRFPDDTYAGVFVYYMGDVYLKQQRFGEMEERFKRYLTTYPGVPMTDGLYYWIGLSSIFTNNLEQAKDYYTRLTTEYQMDETSYWNDGYYRLGVTYFGLNDFKEARRRLIKHTEMFPSSTVRGECHFYVGQIFGNEGDLENAVFHYNQVPQYATVHSYIHDAAFEKARLYEAYEMYRDMRDTFQEYIINYEADHDVTDAIYALGQSYLLLNQPLEMLDTYKRAILNYGDDIKKEDLDLIIDEYPVAYYKQKEILEANVAFLNKIINDDVFREQICGLTHEPPRDPETGEYTESLSLYPKRNQKFVFFYLDGRSDPPETEFNPKLVDKDIKRTLQREMKFALEIEKNVAPLEEWLREWQAKLDSFPNETPEETFEPMAYDAYAMGEYTKAFRLMRGLETLGINVLDDHVFSPNDFEYCSPHLLAWVGNKVMDSDGQTARLAFEYILDTYPDSEAVLKALFSLGRLYEEYYFKPDEALGYYEEVFNNYPASEMAPIAVMKQADMLHKTGDIEGAVEMYDMISMVREWKKLHGEVWHKLGVIRQEQGDLEAAHRAFQKGWGQYRSHKKWAILSAIKDHEVLIALGQREEARKPLQQIMDRESFYSDVDEIFDLRNLYNSL